MNKYHPAPERRRFLKGTLLSLAAAAATILPVRRLGAADVTDQAVRCLHQIIRSPAAARRIGQQYLSRNDQISRNRQALLMELFDGAIDADDLPAMAPAKIRRHLLKRIDDDYVSGNLTDIDGWMMAKTEATLCSILALS